MKEKMMKNQIKREECRNWFCSHIVVISVVCFALGLFLSSCHFVKAADMITYSDLDNYFNSIAYHDTSFDNLYEQAKEECPYFYTAEFTWQGDKWIQIFFSEYDGLTYSTFLMNSNAAYFSYGGDFVYLRNIESVPTGSKIYVISGSPNTSDHCVMRVNTKGVRLYYPNGYYGYSGYCYNYDRTTLNGSGIYMENPSTPIFKYIKGEFNFFYNYSDHILENNFLTYTDDERLKFYTTYAQNGEDLLTTDITEFVEDFPIQDSSHSSMELVDGTITLTVDSDGTLTTYEINAVNSKTTTTKYKFITPYSYFDLLGDDIKIVNCSFSLTGNGQGIEPYTENYYISCEYWIKHTHEQAIYNDNPYKDDVDGNVLTNSEKQALQYLVDFDHGSGLTFSEYQGLNKPDFFEDDAVFVYISDGGTFQDLLEDISNIPFLGQYSDMIASFINNIDDSIELQTAIYDYLYDNAYTQTHSMIVFVYIESWTDWTAGTFSTDDLTYYYYITTYGRIRELNQTLADLYISEKQIELNTASIFDEVDGFEDSFVDFFNMSISDNSTIIGWLSTINNSINSLDFPVFDWEPFNDDDILNALYTIVANQDNPKDGYTRYIAWVKSESNSDNGFKLWANDMFDVFHDIYNFFNYQDDIDPNTPGLQKYIVYVQQYIKYLTQATNDIDSSQYVYYKGIFDNTYNIHNVDGRSG